MLEKNHEEVNKILFATLKYVPRLDRIKIISDIPLSKESDWKELKKAIQIDLNISVSEKSILNLAQKGLGLKNQTINIIAAFLLFKQAKLREEEKNFQIRLVSSSNYYYSKYLSFNLIQNESLELLFEKEDFPIMKNYLSNKQILLVIGFPILFLIGKLLFSGWYWPNVLSIYAIFTVMWYFHKYIDSRMGFSQPIVGTAIFLTVNTFAYFYSYHIMPNFQIIIKPIFRDMYYWGLTFTNIMLNSMTLQNFIGYAKEWRKSNYSK
jgi:hypothetical protein